MKKIVDFWLDVDQSKPLRGLQCFHHKGWKTMKQRFRSLKDMKTLYRYKDIVEKGGRFQDRMRTLSCALIDRFIESRVEQLEVVTDDDLLDMAFDEARKMDFTEFRGSESWLYNFKKHYKLVSRKVTQIVTAQKRRDQEKLEDEVIAFRCQFIDLQKDYNWDCIWNADQSGFSREVAKKGTIE
jgi:hypothetical protein